MTGTSQNRLSRRASLLYTIGFGVIAALSTMGANCDTKFCAQGQVYDVKLGVCVDAKSMSLMTVTSDASAVTVNLVGGEAAFEGELTAEFLDEQGQAIAAAARSTVLIDNASETTVRLAAQQPTAPGRYRLVVKLLAEGNPLMVHSSAIVVP